MTDQIFDVLDKQLKLRRLEERQSTMRSVAALAFLSPQIARHLRYTADMPTLFLKAFNREMKQHTCSFNSLMTIIDSSADFTPADFHEFAGEAMLLAGVSLATNNSQEYWDLITSVRKCDMCERGYRAFALSHAALAPHHYELELCLEMGHAPELQYHHFTFPLHAACDRLTE